MGFFIEQSEANNETKMIFTKAAVYYYAMWAMFIFGFLAWQYDDIFYVPMLIAVVVMFVFAVPYWPSVFKIKKAMREGQVIATGSKYSFSNPLTYVIQNDAES